MKIFVNKKILKPVFSGSAVAILFIAAISLITAPNANAFDIDKFVKTDGVGQSLECVIVVVGCDGKGSVGSSGDTTIGSNNGDNNNDDDNGDEVPNTPGDHVICHHAPGNPEQTQTLSLSENAAQAHLTHHDADTDGPCKE